MQPGSLRWLCTGRAPVSTHFQRLDHGEEKKKKCCIEIVIGLFWRSRWLTSLRRECCDHRKDGGRGRADKSASRHNEAEMKVSAQLHRIDKIQNSCHSVNTCHHFSSGHVSSNTTPHPHLPHRQLVHRQILYTRFLPRCFRLRSQQMTSVDRVTKCCN